MGKFKDVGNPALALAEECAEVIQVINKLHRFYGEWDEIPEGKDISRWEELCNEMNDVLYQWNRLVIEIHQSKTDNAPLTEESWRLLAKMNKDS